MLWFVEAEVWLDVYWVGVWGLLGTEPGLYCKDVGVYLARLKPFLESKLV